LTVYYTVEGTAIPGSDYVALSGSVTLPGSPIIIKALTPAGDTATAPTGLSSNLTLPEFFRLQTVSIDVKPLMEMIGNGPKSVVVKLAPSSAYTFDPAGATAWITRNDVPSVSISATQTPAAEQGKVRGKIRFTRTGSKAGALRVRYTQAGSATAGVDEALLSGTVTIPTGKTYADVTITPIDDKIPESTETVTLILSQDAAYTFNPTQDRATVVLTDNDTVPAPISNLQVSGSTATKLTLQWQDNSDNEIGFKVEKSLDGVNYTTALVSKVANTTTCSILGLVPSTQYWFRVKAFNAAGDATAGTPVSAFTSGPPAAPTMLTVTPTGATSVHLSWVDHAINETGFMVEESTNHSTYSVISAGLAADSTAFDVTGLQPNTRYWFRVKSVNLTGSSRPCAAVEFSTQGVPAAPSNLQVSVTGTSSVHLGWTDNADNETGFRIEISTDNLTFSPAKTLTNSNLLECDISSLTPGTLYWFRVLAINGAGASAPSAAVSARTAAAAQPPSAPSNLRATASSTSTIRLSWQDNASNESGFTVEKSTDNSTFAVLSTISTPNTTACDATGLSPGTTYWFRVKAWNSAGSSAPTASVSVTTLQLPAAPSTLQASPTGFDSIHLTWHDNSSNETAFLIEYSTSSNFLALSSTTSAANTTSFDIAGLTPGTQYWFRVSSRNANGTSSPCSAVSATTLKPVPPPSDLTARATSSSLIELDWIDNATDEDEYVVEHSTDGINFALYYETQAPNIQALDDSGLSPGSKHYYRIKARRGTIESSYSNIAFATTLSTGTPAKPANLSAVATSSTSVLLTWTPSDCDHYRLYQGVGATSTPVFLADIAGKINGAAVNAVPVVGLSPGQTYRYSLAAFNTTNALSPQSTIVTVTTQGSSGAAQSFDNFTGYPLISLKIDGQELITDPSKSVPSGARYFYSLSPGTTHTYSASNGFWNGGQREALYNWGATPISFSASTTPIKLVNPSIHNLLTQSSSATATGYWTGAYFLPTIGSYAFRFKGGNDATGIYNCDFFVDGQFRWSSTYKMSAYNGDFMPRFQVTIPGTNGSYWEGVLYENTGNATFDMRNGPSQWPAMEYSFDGQ
jgi:titin